MHIALLRHGLTAGNLRKAYLGVRDEPLCQEGVQALRASSVAREVLDFVPDCERVYVSTRKRTQETASLLFPDLSQVVSSSLDEMNFGIFEGKNYQDLSLSASYGRWVEGGCSAVCPEGEGLETFLPRVKEGFLSAVEGEESGKIFVVHGGTIMGICSQFVLGSTYYQWQVPCGGALFFHWKDGRLEAVKQSRSEE